MAEPVPENKSTDSKSAASAPFRPGVMSTAIPPADIKPLLTNGQAHEAPIAHGVDLGGRPKIILTAGRGKTGKTLFLRWLAESAQKADRPHLLADIDPTNATFSSYFENVSRPDTFNQTAVRDWLQEFIEYAIANRITAIIDLGGGDTVLRTIASEMPGFDTMIDEAGLSMAMFYLVGPHPEDLTPAATLSALGFNPNARAIVLNEGVAPLGTSREQAFARVVATDVYKAQITSGTIPLWMPRLFAADAIEARTASFAAARDGKTNPPLGIFDRSRVNTWLRRMDEQFAGVNSWMP